MGNSWLIRVAKRSVYFHRIHVNLGFFHVKTGVFIFNLPRKDSFFMVFTSLIMRNCHVYGGTVRYQLPIYQAVST